MSTSKFKQHYNFIKDNYFRLPIKQISDAIGLSEKYIQVQASIHGITKLRPPIDIEALIKDYTDGMYATQIERKYHTSKKNIQKIMKDNNIHYRNRSDVAKKYKINQDFFKTIDTEEKAYFFGYMMADGNVYKNSFKLELQKTDRNILEKFLIALEAEHSVYEYDNTESCQVLIRNKKLVNDLISLGCIPRKTFNLKYPTFIRDDLMRHFIRGYFDGDGSVVLHKFKNQKRYMWRLSIMAPESFCEEMMKHLQYISSVKWKYRQDKRIKIDMKTLSCQSSVGKGGAITISSLYDYFYKESNIFLERKKKLFEEILQIAQNHEKRIVRVMVDGIVFENMVDAANHCGIKYATFRFRLFNNADKYGYRMLS